MVQGEEGDQTRLSYLLNTKVSKAPQHLLFFMRPAANSN